MCGNVMYSIYFLFIDLFTCVSVLPIIYVTGKYMTKLGLQMKLDMMCKMFSLVWFSLFVH
jgi:hypothetical protein